MQMRNLLVLALLASVMGLSVEAKTDLSGTVNSQPVTIQDQVTQSAERSLEVGDYKSAEKAFREALAGAGKKAPELTRARIELGLGESLLWQGRFGEAAAEFKRAQSLLGKGNVETPEMARFYDAMSWMSQAQNDPTKARDFATKAVELRRKVTPGTPDMAESLEHLASLMEGQALYDPALAIYQEALGIRQKTSGESSVQVANNLEQIARLMQRQGNTANAQKMYRAALAMKSDYRAPFSAYAPHLASETVVYRFWDGAPNCARTAIGTASGENISIDGLTVEASITPNASDFAKTSRATIRIINHSDQPVDLMPQPPMFLTLAPKVRMCNLLNAQDLANQIEKKGEKKAQWIRFWGADAMTTATTTVSGGNNYAPGWGYVPSPFGYAPAYGYVPPSYRYRNNPTVITTQVPDYQARARAEAKAQAVTSKSATAAQAVREQALLPGTIPPGCSMQGSLDFDQADFKKAILRVPIGNSVFEFLFGDTK